MSMNLVAGPTEEPITLLAAKDHLRVDDTTDDAYISQLIVMARVWCENYLQRALVTQTWDYFINKFPGSDKAIEIPFAPLQSVTTVKYTDPDGAQQTWDNAEYVEDLNTRSGLIFPAFGFSYPAIRLERNAVEIRFIAGYGQREVVPLEIVQALMLVMGHFYNNREDSIIGVSANKIPMGASSLLWSHRIFGI